MKVFISYAREDWEIAERVWGDLKQAGIDAWIDRKKLLPGQNWKTEISKAIRASSHFIALLSTRSVSKQGFFQTELKKAIDVLDTFPEHRIYFIPVRIDNCEPGYERIGDIHRADMFPSYEEGLSQILRVLAPDYRAKTAAQPSNISEKPVEVIPIISKNPEEKSATQPQAPILRYQLRKEPVTTNDPVKAFNLKSDKDGCLQPTEYLQNNFRDNRDGTITDHATGLMWQKSGSSDYMYYKRVSAYIEKLNREKFAGYSDWRLPTVNELKSLITQEQQSNDLYINPIFDENQSWCWTSDRHMSGEACFVNFFTLPCFGAISIAMSVRFAPCNDFHADFPDCPKTRRRICDDRTKPLQKNQHHNRKR